MQNPPSVIIPGQTGGSQDMTGSSSNTQAQFPGTVPGSTGVGPVGPHQPGSGPILMPGVHPEHGPVLNPGVHPEHGSIMPGLVPILA